MIFKGGGTAVPFTYELAAEVNCDGSVFVPEQGSEPSLVYPNPSQGFFNLNLGIGTWQVQVYDITGRKIVDQPMNGKGKMDLSVYQKGLYFLKARNGEREINTKIVVR